MAPLKCLVIPLVLLIPCCANRPEQKKVQVEVHRMPETTQPRFASAFEAASAAGNLAKLREARLAETWTENARKFEGPEFGGRIWRLPDGTFTYTSAPVITQKRLAELNAAITAYNKRHPENPRTLAAGACHPRSAPQGPKGAVEVALWHTHPGSASFSSTDHHLATRHRLPFFLIRDRQLGNGIVTECYTPAFAPVDENYAPTQLLAASP